MTIPWPMQPWRNNPMQRPALQTWLAHSAFYSTSVWPNSKCQLPWHKIWGSWTHVPCKLGILHVYDDDTSKPSLQGWPLHWIVPPGLHWSGDGHGMVMVCLSKKSWEVCTSVYHNHIYTHMCVRNNIYFTWKRKSCKHTMYLHPSLYTIGKVHMHII
jgi:hypothetical protein